MDVAKQGNHTLTVDYSADGLTFSIQYKKGVFREGSTYPWGGQRVIWARWDWLVAWVELQRREEALQQALQKKS